MYGTRRAALLWGDKFASALCGEGFCRGKSCGQFFWHEKKEITLVCHGDDSLAERSEASLDWLDGVLGKEFVVKAKGRVGPGPGGGGAVAVGPEPHGHAVVADQQRMGGHRCSESTSLSLNCYAVLRVFSCPGCYLHPLGNHGLHPGRDEVPLRASSEAPEWHRGCADA